MRLAVVGVFAPDTTSASGTVVLRRSEQTWNQPMTPEDERMFEFIR